MNILGISCFYHDAAACLIMDGEIVAAASEERFTRKKHDPDFPKNAIEYCLHQGKISIRDVDYVGFYDKPFIKFERILYTYISTFPRSLFSFTKAIPIWLKQKLWVPQIIRRELNYHGKVVFIEHHLSHAASAFLFSPFNDAAILTIDGVGEWATATYGIGRNNTIVILKEIHFPHSLGLLYSAFTYYLGFKVNSAEYKVMGLAPHGRPIYYDKVRKCIDIKEDGSFKLNMRYFAYDYGLTMTNGYFNDLFGGPPRVPESDIEQRHMDIAASIQKVTEEVVLKMANYLYKETGLKNLCMAGGVALNCVANGKILRQTPFEHLFIQPAAGDAGGAVGVAGFIYHSILGNERRHPLRHVFLGPGFTTQEVRDYLLSRQVRFSEYTYQDLVKEVAHLIESQYVVGWFQGRMEFGPRALGSRSVLADARNPQMKDTLNTKIKLREGFRPFAPAVLEENAREYFELDCTSPYMLLCAQVKEDKRIIPSVTHMDGSARMQTVSREDNPLFHDLIKEFYHRTGVPVIINTSFNVRGEPIVCTPDEAFRCFMRTDMDYLVMDRFILDKKEIPPLDNSLGSLGQFEPD